HEHNEICLINARNNYLLRPILFLICIFGSTLFDLLLYQSFNIDTFVLVKIVFMITSIYTIFIITIFVYSAAAMCKSAHSPYKKLSSIMVSSVQYVTEQEATIRTSSGNKQIILKASHLITSKERWHFVNLIE